MIHILSVTLVTASLVCLLVALKAYWNGLQGGEGAIGYPIVKEDTPDQWELGQSLPMRMKKAEEMINKLEGG